MDAGTIAQPERLRARSWPAVELITAIGLLELELWYLRANGPAWLNVLVYLAIVGAIAHANWRRRATPSQPTQGVARSWSEAIAVCLGLSTILVIASGFVGDSNETFEFVFLDKPPLKLVSWLLGKFVAALVQQVALQLFLWPTCSELARSKAVGAVLAASLFGLIHLPSPTLVAITTLAGLVWIALHHRSNRLAPLVVSHMILATLAHGSLPERLTYDMRVGSTAMADMGRFAKLNDPHVRLINRRLKENRASLRRFTSIDYYQAQGNNDRDFVRGLFRDIYGRPATEADVQFWANRPLANRREDLPPFFLASDEYAKIRQERRASQARASVRR